MARTEPDGMGNPPFRTWAEAHPQVSVGSFADAAAAGELIVNATSGAGSLPSLTAAGEHNLAGKVLLDVANPLDLSAGMPPTLLVKDTDSLGELIQRTFPQAKVVKALNTMNALVMVHPDRVPGDHSVFVAGDHEDAKQTIMDLLHGFGWSAEDIVDLGGIRSARGVEMYLPLWLSLWQVLGTGDFQHQRRASLRAHCSSPS
jgi:hypothetical protein